MLFRRYALRKSLLSLRLCPIFEPTIDTRIERREARDLLWDRQEEILVANEAFPS